MKKIDKNNLAIIFAGLACILLIIGGYLAYTGISARANEANLVEQLDKANETNQALQANLKTVKDLLIEEQNKVSREDNVSEGEVVTSHSDDGVTGTYTYEKPSKEAIKKSLDSVTGAYVDEKYPIRLDDSSINYLEAYDINASTIKLAYELKLSHEGYPEELGGEGQLERIELIDANTCFVTLSGDDLNVNIIYSLDYDLGITFNELNKEVIKKVDVDTSYFDMSLTNKLVGITAKYDMQTLEVLDSDLILRHNMLDYSPDNKYMTIISYNPGKYLLGEDTIKNYGTRLIIKKMDTKEIIYEEDLEELRTSMISWSSDSQRFILNNRLYYDFENMKTKDLLVANNETYQVMTSTITKDYIVTFGIIPIGDGLNQAFCKVYDWDYNFVEEVFLFEILDDPESTTNIEDFFFPKTLFDNTIELSYYSSNSANNYVIELNDDQFQVNKIDNYLEIYTYIPELELKFREVLSSGSDKGTSLIFEAYDGQEVFRTEYSQSLVNGYLGANEESMELYFVISNVDHINESFEEVYLLTYDIEDNRFSRELAPIDHLNGISNKEEAYNWPISYSQGVLTIQTIIPLGEMLLK